jgi:glutamyl-Q tRNA(Asp) synthetase
LSPPVFRFAPSPNGYLHLGHAYSALLNQQMARESGGRLLLRIEDIDIGRCRPAYESAILEDLDWLGIKWEEPVRRQSEHFDDYAAALQMLASEGLIYTSFLSRKEIDAAAKSSPAPWPRDPLGVPHNPAFERSIDPPAAAARAANGENHALRLNMAKALAKAADALAWTETGSGGSERVSADAAAWGDVILARKETPTSYHLSVTVDDALQGVTRIVRGSDLFHSTSIHRLLQALLHLPEPIYHHHQLITAPAGPKLSKSARSPSLRDMRQQGQTPANVRRQLGF